MPPQAKHSEDSTTAYGGLVTCICGCAEYRRSLVRIGIDFYDLWIFPSPRCISYISHFGRMAILREITILVKMAILVEMAMHAQTWPYMAIYGHVWPCMAMHGRVWPCMPRHGHVWPCMAMYGRVWPCMPRHGHIFV